MFEKDNFGVAGLGVVSFRNKEVSTMKKIHNLQKDQILPESALQPVSRTNRSRKGLLYSLAAGSIILEAYMGLVRPWILHWGASDVEIKSHLPGDALVDHPRYNATHAITIKAPAARIWPWLVQIGQGRGGFYSYDWLENLVGCDIHNANQILPQFQELKLDSLVRLAPPPAKAGMPDLVFKVALIEPQRALVIVTPGSFEATAGTLLPFASWAFILQPLDETACRLIIRFRSTYHLSLGGFLINQALLEPIHFVMERKMLLGIKQRSERANTSRQTSEFLATNTSSSLEFSEFAAKEKNGLL